MFRLHSAIFLLGVTATSAEHDVIRKPPQIFTPVPDHTVEVFNRNRQPLRVPCNATGLKPITYKWTQNGKDIPNGNRFVTFDPESGTLSMPSGVSSEQEEGDYRCLATNQYGTSMSQIVRIKATVEPAFDATETKVVEVVEYKGDAIECRGKPRFLPEGFYDWDLVSTNDEKSTQIPSSERLSVDAKGTLYIINADMALNQPGSEYGCVKHSHDKTVSYMGGLLSIRVTKSQSGSIETPPKLLGSTQQSTVDVGKLAVLECFFSGQPIPNITWYDSRDRVIAVSDQKYRLMTNEYNRKLKIDVIEDDEGNFRCEAQNRAGTAHSTIFLNVTSPPIFVKKPANVISVLGSDATFRCQARPAVKESPLPPPVWFVNGNPIETVSRIGGRYAMSADKIQLTFRNVTFGDVMCVQCSVMNERGYTFGDAYLTVIDPLIIRRKPDDVIEVERNQSSVYLTISATGDNCCKLQFSWFLDDAPLEVTTIGRQPYSYIQDENTATLTISLQGSAEEFEKVLGLYRCYVWNVVYHTQDNNHNKNVTVLLKMKPEQTVPPVSGVQASASLWWLGILFGIIVLIAAGVVIYLMIHNNYPRQEYHLEQEEIRHKLNPEKDLLEQSFVQI